MIRHVKFMPWVKWGDLAVEKYLKEAMCHPCAYLLAHCDKPPVSDTPWTAKEILYIDCTSCMTVRHSQFIRVVTGKATDHLGGRAYRKKYGNEIRPNLHVALCPIEVKDKSIRQNNKLLTWVIKRGLDHFEERLLVEYARNNRNQMPELNKLELEFGTKNRR